MISWWKRSLARQLIGFILLALVVSQVLSFLISWDEQDKALKAASKSEFFTRTGSITRLMEVIPAELREEVLQASETSTSRFWVTTDPPTDLVSWRRSATSQLVRPIRNAVALPPEWGLGSASRQTGIARSAEAKISPTAGMSEWVQAGGTLWPLDQAARYADLVTPNGIGSGMGMAVQLKSGLWLNTAYFKSVGTPWWRSPSLYSFALSAVILSVIVILATERIIRPMRQLAAAADALGRGENIAPIAESGPDDIRLTAVSFNRMQQRLHRYVEDRVRMLAAIGHDLRTPLTSLRLRAELVSDSDVQKRMLDTIDEVQTMAEATIAFAKGEASTEETRTIDLCALVESLCHDLGDLGHKVEFIEGKKTHYRCRPGALRRAIRNLVENAVRYGGSASVSIVEREISFDILIKDRGPGIPEDMRDKVFSPFFRMEKSRNRQTGGIGLGMSIARAIVRHHGGDIELSSGNPGLTACVRLPKADRASIVHRSEVVAAHWTL
ncbi:HAMP domain-containing sensor histidine kinase [Rhizobium terrae]|uniref:HAMP domain-containing sensor histidine kinase n=1 Tax=Rhizobium terrae TaxID=2171756 RepID=UPI000E3C8832|nr:HAMP domain-containing sensor histidine kinase [Rhizobium terrae]